MYVCICVYIYIYTCMHTCIDTHQCICSRTQMQVLCRSFYNAATMQDKLQQASTQFRETKWVVEDELKKQRAVLETFM